MVYTRQAHAPFVKAKASPLLGAQTRTRNAQSQSPPPPPDAQRAGPVAGHWALGGSADQLSYRGWATKRGCEYKLRAQILRKISENLLRMRISAGTKGPLGPSSECGWPSVRASAVTWKRRTQGSGDVSPGSSGQWKLNKLWPLDNGPL